MKSGLNSWREVVRENSWPVGLVMLSLLGGAGAVDHLNRSIQQKVKDGFFQRSPLVSTLEHSVAARVRSSLPQSSIIIPEEATPFDIDSGRVVDEMSEASVATTDPLISSLESKKSSSAPLQKEALDFDITPALLDTIASSRKGRKILRAQHFSNWIFIPQTETFHKKSKLHHYFRDSVHVNGRAAVYRDGYRGERYYFTDGKAEVVFLRVGDQVVSGEQESLSLELESDQARRTDLIGSDAKKLEKMYGFFSKRSLVHYLGTFGGERAQVFYRRILQMHGKEQYRGSTEQNQLLFRYLSGMELEKLEKILQGVTPQEEMVRGLVEEYFPEKSWGEAMKVAKGEGMFMPLSIQPKSENEGGGTDIGLFQINTKWNAPLLIKLGYTPKDLLDPKINVSVAAEIYKKHGWGKWHAAVKLGIVHEG